MPNHIFTFDNKLIQNYYNAMAYLNQLLLIFMNNNMFISFFLNQNNINII